MRSSICSWITLLALTAAAGCSQTSDTVDDNPPLATAKGIVKVDGKPLPGAVVTFLPKSGYGGVGETKDDGSYQLSHMGSPGVPVNDYVVSISFLVGSDGKPQNLGARSSLVQPDSMLGAKELLPPKYSDLGQSILRANVPPEGGTFDFNLEGPMPSIPAPAETSKNVPTPEIAPAAKSQESDNPSTPSTSSETSAPIEPAKP